MIGVVSQSTENVSMSRYRTVRWMLVAVLGAGPLGVLSAAPAADPGYTPVAKLPVIIDGQPLRDFAFDASASRLFACSKLGLFWAELGRARPVLKGPLFAKDLLRIELAPDLGRLFYFTDDEIGFVDIRNDPTVPVPLSTGPFRAVEMVYEPTRREIYIATRSPRIIVIDGLSGRQGRDVTVPGWYAFGLEATPGRVFMNVGSKGGLFQIDAGTHEVTGWEVEGDLGTPLTLESDRSGRTLFAAFDRYLVAIDTQTAREKARLVTSRSSSMAFDPGTAWLVASWSDWQRPVLRMRAFTVDDAFLEAADIDGAQGEIPYSAQTPVPRLEPLYRGFLQVGRRSMIVWRANVPRS